MVTSPRIHIPLPNPFSPQAEWGEYQWLLLYLKVRHFQVIPVLVVLGRGQRQRQGRLFILLLILRGQIQRLRCDQDHWI
jgi:hypothetical protein